MDKALVVEMSRVRVCCIASGPRRFAVAAPGDSQDLEEVQSAWVDSLEEGIEEDIGESLEAGAEEGIEEGTGKGLEAGAGEAAETA